jgi:hypothetical protein
MADDNKPLRVTFAVAFVTALGTSLASSWLPSVATNLVEWLRQEPILFVLVHDGDRPVKDVKIAVSSAASDEVLDSGATDEAGAVKLRKASRGMLYVVASYDEGTVIRWHKELHKIEALPHVIRLDKEKSFPLRLARAPAPPAPAPQTGGAGAGGEGSPYGKPLLTSDRSVQARLEIDWVEGTSPPGLSFHTSAGPARIEDVFREVGVELEVLMSDALPAGVMGADGAFNNEELMAAMNAHRNISHEGKWNFYLIVAPRATTPVGSFLFDAERRQGSVILTEYGRELGALDPQYLDPRFITYEVIHEVGHMLNLPHPWQKYADTRSVMSSPYRWADWSWDDPQVYRFDEFGRRHIRRAPDEYVRPGGSAFLDYGPTQK